MKILDDNKIHCPFCDFECYLEGYMDEHIEYNHYDEVYYLERGE